MEYCKTLDELFNKYPELNNPEKAGVEFYQFVGPEEENDLLVITSLDEIPGTFSYSGFEKGEYPVGTYLLSFPYYARTMIFSDVESIDKHLTDNKGQFKLPGYTYKD